MNNAVLKKTLGAVSLLLSAGFMQVVYGHTAGTTLDAGGGNASATDLASVNCYDDGGGAPDHLAIQVEDQSAPVPGLLVNMQAFKGQKMTNVTDPVSGDGNASPVGILRGGAGAYLISVNKTAAGARAFSVTYHCEASGGAHTGTDVSVYQLQ